jgi:oligopeptide transport system ATP-binding protein
MGHEESDSSEILSRPIHDTGSVWLSIISFFLPVLGIIAAFLFRKKNYINNYKKCKKGAIVGFIVLVAIIILFAFLLFLATL